MRTIFISLFSNIVVGNFSSPNGVLDQLMAKKERDTRIIFLTAEGFRDKIEKYLNDNVKAEIIEKHNPRGMFQNIFHFFYAYLIFTGTTKILATYGARADTPPAGGNRFIAPFKALNARTFGRSNFVKTKIVPFLFKKIFRARHYRALFDRYQPELIFLPNIAFFPDIELLSEAKRRGIKTLGMACNWDHLNKYYIPFQADHLLVQNESMRNEAVTLHAYKPEQTESVGFPQFDVYFKYLKRQDSRKSFCEKFNIPFDSKIIVFVSGAAYALDEPDLVKEIVNWIHKNKFGVKAHLLIRPYVIARDKDNEAKKFMAFQGNPLISFNFLRRDEGLEGLESYFNMLRYADIVVPIFSTMAIEAAIFDKPTITIGFDGHKKRPAHQSIKRLEQLTHFKNVLDTGSIVMARSFPELYQNIREYLHNPEKDREKRRNLVEKMCFRFDGKASERIVGAILMNLK